MSDIVGPARRSRMMAGIRGKDTSPEMVIRRGLHGKGFRFRLHDRRLPGKPDLVLKKYNALILVNGCFWHGHNCHLFKWPRTRVGFWKSKIEGNRIRDAKYLDQYRKNGWRVLIVWECAIKGKLRLDQVILLNRISKWLEGNDPYAQILGTKQSSKS